MENKKDDDLMEYVPYTSDSRSFIAPTQYTLFTRLFIPWQLIKFAHYNIKMLRILSKGHGRFMDE
ncbi:MAG: hypothetical protein M1502_04500 [Deltaproteobacteria bacterium]|uniref:Uncharacterized protein n=1 Tax=Candidatus Acidulodesulfobacterium acidiphilum TaxID=2597224 RepID=A0A520XBC6_9DELT|nr:hypothetical protein [Deltaproteobacteria bacterium]MDA8299381.1 hypothetical protein [Deltaproteobacteria bacterium]RZV38513.1 MAG: hypothetical protein EVJ48_06715 [Candidatus Acidulodesulfobacterium acidiphilum]